jgi:predicted nucleotidyltransferase
MAQPREFIDPIVESRIQAELSAVERERGVKVLIAVESGSRAWGFPSADSDYDVRFIYVHPPEFYLTVFPKRDVIEKPIDKLLDIGGWDVRKALGLMMRSNAALLEWLHSPVRYRDVSETIQRFLDLAYTSVDLTALAYHYDRQARRSHDDIVAANGAVRLKTYFYALRPALALMWLRTHDKPPPMALRSLMAGLDLPRELGDCVSELLKGHL